MRFLARYVDNDVCPYLQPLPLCENVAQITSPDHEIAGDRPGELLGLIHAGQALSERVIMGTLRWVALPGNVWRQRMKGDRLFMVNKEFTRYKLILGVALLMVIVGVVSLGARQSQGVRVPPGAIVKSPNASVGMQKPQPIPAAPALPAESTQAAFLDNFSTNLDGWQTVQTEAATWGARDGRLQQWGDATGEPVDVPSVLAARNITVGDGKIEAHIFPTGGSPVGLVFRGSDAGYYRLDLNPNLPDQTAKVVLRKVTSTGEAKIAETPATAWPGYAYSTWQLVSISMAGSNIVVSVDGTQVLTANDSSFNTGWAGVWAFANSSAQFDNVRIQQAGSR